MSTTTDARDSAAPNVSAQVRDLSREEIATLDIGEVTKNNSASLEELVDNKLITGQLFVDVGN